MITKKIQLYNHIGTRNQPIKYIVIHDTGNTSRGAGAIAHERYFKTTDRKASADFVVDEKNVIQLNNYRKYFTWHCGDGRGKYGITNSNSIGIEMCINQDNDQYMTHQNTIELTRQLMKELNVPLENVVRHYDASRKSCPNSLRSNNWSEWWKFKEKLKVWDNDLKEFEKSPQKIKVIIDDRDYLVDGFFYENKNYLSIAQVCALLDIKISNVGAVPVLASEK